jgi:DNA-binding transcriptional regulator YiaG
LKKNYTIGIRNSVSENDVRKLRVRLDLTQEELAKAFGLANGLVVSRWESGNRNPGQPIIRLVKFLNDLPKAKALAILEKFADYK